MKDPYKSLNVKKSSTQTEIKSAYRKLALQFHPDKNPDNAVAEEKFKEIASAYEILSDIDKKTQYDTYGSVGARPQQNPYAGFNPFSDFFGGVSSPFVNQRRVRGQDIKKAITIDFMDAALGCYKNILVEYPYPCSACKQTGAKNGIELEQCKTCNGQGKVGQQSGFMQIIHNCPTCEGSGNKIKEKCDECSGIGTKQRKNKLKVTIPAGLSNGTAMRLSGKGMPGPYGGVNGNLYVVINITPHPRFKQFGNAIHSNWSINYIDAILGTEIKTATIHGMADVKIPSGTQPGDVIKIKGKGISAKCSSGDHFINIQVNIPKEINKEEKKLIKELQTIKDKK